MILPAPLRSQEQPGGNVNDTMRVCPTVSGDTRPLITHRIEVKLCLGRQREHYHKCHRCQYRGKPADFVAEERIELTPVAETGMPKERVDLQLRPDEKPE